MYFIDEESIEDKYKYDISQHQRFLVIKKASFQFSLAVGFGLDIIFKIWVGYEADQDNTTLETSTHLAKMGSEFSFRPFRKTFFAFQLSTADLHSIWWILIHLPGWPKNRIYFTDDALSELTLSVEDKKSIKNDLVSQYIMPQYRK